MPWDSSSLDLTVKELHALDGYFKDENEGLLFNCGSEKVRLKVEHVCGDVFCELF